MERENVSTLVNKELNKITEDGEYYYFYLEGKQAFMVKKDELFDKYGNRFYCDI